MTTTGARPNAFVSRLAGLVADLILLTVFLILGLTILNVLVQLVVLIVGIVHMAMLPKGFVNPEQGRLAADSKDLVVAIVEMALAAVAHWGFLKLRRKLLHYFVDAGFETFVSKRYLLAREGSRLVSLISIVSVAGVAVGVMALIVVISVMQGFDDTLVKKFMGIYSHIEVMPDTRYVETGEIPHDTYVKLMETMSKADGVLAVAPLLTHETVVQAKVGAEEKKTGVYIRGIDYELEKNVSDFYKFVKPGMGTPNPGFREAVVGEELARRLHLQLGDKIQALGKVVSTANRPAAKMMSLKVVGIFNSGLYEVDERFILTDLKTLQEMLVIGDSVTSVHARVKDPYKAEQYGMGMLSKLPEGYGFRTWQKLNQSFFEALWVEKVAMFIILMLIVLVAALNIIGTLVMTVVQKTRDIGVLKSMGAGSGSILRIFLLHGFLIGLVGTSLGTVWGLRICVFVRDDIDKIFQLPPGVYGLDRLPVVIDPMLIAFMAACALTICIVASIIPAWQAARLHPVEALRYD